MLILDKKIIKAFLPFIGAMLIAFGYVKLSLYYNHFDISINNYLEFSEVLTLFLPDVIKYGLIIFMSFLFSFIIEPKSTSVRLNNLKKSIADSSNLFDRIKKLAMISVFWSWVLLFTVITDLVLFIWFREMFWNSFLSTAILPAYYIFMFILFEFKHKYKEIYDEYLNPTYTNIILIFIMFGFFSISSVFGEIEKVENGKKKLVSFKYADEKIKTNDNLIYLGQTKKYLFLHDKKKRESRVFERSELKEFKITHANKK